MHGYKLYDASMTCVEQRARAKFFAIKCAHDRDDEQYILHWAHDAHARGQIDVFYHQEILCACNARDYDKARMLCVDAPVSYQLSLFTR